MQEKRTCTQADNEKFFFGGESLYIDGWKSWMRDLIRGSFCAILYIERNRRLKNYDSQKMR